MNAAKRQNLQAMGGREVSLTEFLDLKPGEEELIDLQIALGQDMKMRRLSKGWTQSELAHALGTTQSYVTRMEQGSASTDLLLRALFVLGASHQEIASAIVACSEAACGETTISNLTRKKEAAKTERAKLRRTKSQPRVLAGVS